MRLNSHIRATKIEDPTQTHNNRILWGSIIIIDNYFGTGHYEKYCSQLRPTASAGCNISHNAMCLSNYPLNITHDFENNRRLPTSGLCKYAWLNKHSRTKTLNCTTQRLTNNIQPLETKIKFVLIDVVRSEIDKSWSILVENNKTSFIW